MLEMLCALPAPCGGEEIVKKYICQKYPAFREDALGNLVAHFPGEGPAVMLYAPLDEDAVIAMDVQADKVFFAHLGKRKIYPSAQVSFGGFTGIVCTDAENPLENQYIRMLDGKDVIQPGRIGVIDGDFEEAAEETQSDEDWLLGKNIAARAAACAMLSQTDIRKNVYLVLGVQSNHGNKGLSAAIQTLNPDKVVLFEETDGQTLCIKRFAKGFSLTERMEEEIRAVFDQEQIPYTYTADAAESTAASAASWGKTAVIGIPVRFRDFARQGIQRGIVGQLEKFIKGYLEA